MIIGMVTKPGPVRRRTPDSRHRTRPRRDSRHATIPPKVSFRSAATWSSANLLSQVKGHFRYFDTVSGHSGPRIQAKGQDPRILRATNTLFRSLTEPVFGQHVAKISPSEAFFGTSVPYARVHQTGAPKANIPKRQPVELTESQRKEWVKTIQSFLRANDR